MDDRYPAREGFHPSRRRRALQGSLGADDRVNRLSRTIVGVDHSDSLLRLLHGQAGVDRRFRHHSFLSGWAKAPRQELRQTRGVPDDRRPLDRVLRDVERRAEHVGVTTEEVRRAEDATPLSLVPVRHARRHGRTRRGMPTPRSRARCSSVTRSEMSRPSSKRASRSAKLTRSPSLEVGPIGPVGQGEGIERRAREPVDVEVTEQIRGDLLVEALGVLPGDRRVEGRAVHQFERPCSDPDRHVSAAGPSALFMDRPAVRRGQRDTRCRRRPR